jgi:serine/threonine protein kinase
VTPERWQRIEEVFRVALHYTPHGRNRYLAEACRDDADLKKEVLSLLASHEAAGSFLDRPPVAVSESTTARLFLPDQLVSERFRIVRFIAEGGMGEVYEAFDTELEERVALKTIRQTILDDEEAEERFARESRLARKVSHPNVCRTHDVFHHTVQSGNYEAQVRFLTMELLNGETLARRLARIGSMPVERALPIARQIAEALRAAHAAGVVHRDLKPDNVMLVPTGNALRAVVTDFGLARDSKPFAAVPAHARGDLLWILHGLQADKNASKGALARLARRARRQMVALGIVSDDDVALTELGRIMGTPAYMSPEQARGDRADERSDVWSFGIVVYEMLSGKLPYRPESSIRGLARKIFHRPRRPARLPFGVPTSLRKAIFRCLEIGRLARYQKMDELVRDLEAIELERGFKLRSPWIYALGVLVVLSLLLWLVL